MAEAGGSPEATAGTRDPRRADAGGIVRHGAIILALSNLGSVFLLLFQRAMALHLPAGDFGAMNALLNALAILTGLACVPLQTIAARRAARFRASGEPGTVWHLFGRWLLRSLAISLAATISLLPLSGSAARFFRVGDPALVPILLGGVPAAFLVASAAGLLQGLQWFWRLGISLAASGAFRYLLGLGVAALGLGLRSALAIQALAGLATLGLILASAARGFREGSAGTSPKPAIGRDLHLPVFAGVALFALLQQLDLILLKHYWPDRPALLDRYAAAQIIGRIVLFGPAALVSVLVPKAIARAVAGADPRPILLRALAAALLVGIACIGAFAVVPEILLRFLGKGRFADARDLLLLYGAAMLFLGIIHVLTHYLSVLNARAFLLVLVAAVAAEILWIDAGHASAAQVIGKLIAIFAMASSLLLAAIFRPGGWTAPRPRPAAALAGPPPGDYPTAGSAAPTGGIARGAS